MEYAIRSLVGVVRREKLRLDSLEARLRSSPAVMQPGIISDIATSADALSSALTRLASHLNEIPPEDAPAPADEVAADPLALEVSRRLAAAMDGLCETCGGVCLTDAEPSPSDVPWASINKARRATD